MSATSPNWITGKTCLRRDRAEATSQGGEDEHLSLLELHIVALRRSLPPDQQSGLDAALVAIFGGE